MAYKTILSVMGAASEVAAMARVTAGLARSFSAHVTGVHVETIPQAVVAAPMEYPDPGAFAALQDEAEARTREVAAAFEDFFTREGLSHDFRAFSSVGEDGFNGAIDLAHVSDLVVMRQFEESASRSSQSDIETLVFEGGRPVLVVPYIIAEFRPIRHAVVAWNGSREAARAAFDALPFLKQAEKVEVLCVDPKPERGGDARIAGWDIGEALARHGIKVTVEARPSGGVPVATIIENHVSESGADLLVMGAYSHNRLREWLFGGATRTIFSSMPTLTLMSR